jgi:RNA ligase
MTISKYPRTRHIEGSRLQQNDLADDKAIAELRGEVMTVEEKIDGANCGISFSSDGDLMLQSRGHYLTGGSREKHFELLKTWANVHAQRFREVLTGRYVMYGEWMFAKHTVFYDVLPHYFMEFDVLDLQERSFLSTEARRSLLRGLPIMPVPVVHRGQITSVADLTQLVRESRYKSNHWRSALAAAAKASGSRSDFVEKQTEDNDLAEGLYLKLEKGGVVEDRFKYVRSDFMQAIQESDGHWLNRPILPNGLMPGTDIFASHLGAEGAYDDFT